jgi:hypothetical protein
MTAHDPSLATIAEIDLALRALDDAKIRRRIVHAWQDYKIDGDVAMTMLISLDLIEVPDGC